MRKNKGFSLIELIITIAIIGILAAIVIPKYSGQQDIGKQKKVLSDLSTIDAAMQLYFVDNAAWPNPAPSSVCAVLSASGYLVAEPFPPSSIYGLPVGASYSYSAMNAGTSYETRRAVVSYNGAWKTTDDLQADKW